MSDRDRKSAEDGGSGAGGSADSSAPGKRTLTSGLEGSLHRAADGNGISDGASAAVERAGSDAGVGLPEGLRGRLEGALGTDLGGVRAHTGQESASASSALGANAYTLGQDIHFGSGQFSPGSPSGDRLIAHEVAHTVQQRGAPPTAVQEDLQVSTPGDAHEQQAESFAQSFVYGGDTTAVTPVSTGVVSRAVIQRDDPPAPVSNGTTGADADINTLNAQQCRTLVSEMYNGVGAYANRGIVNYRLQTIQLMEGQLRATDPPSIESRIFRSILAVGIAAGAGALGAVTGGLGPIAIAALAAGAGETVKEAMTYFPQTENLIDVTGFIENMLNSVREGWPRSVGTLHAGMTTDENSRTVARQIKALRDNNAGIALATRREVLDEWCNAVSIKNSNGTSETARSLGDATEGRLHLSGAWMGWAPGTEWTDPVSATLEGVNTAALRELMLDRKVGDINVIRTMTAQTPLGEVSLALHPGGTQQYGAGAASNDRQKWAIANFMVGHELDRDDSGIMEGSHDQALIDSSVWPGVTKAWNKVREKTLRQLGMRSVGG